MSVDLLKLKKASMRVDQENLEREQLMMTSGSKDLDITNGEESYINYHAIFSGIPPQHQTGTTERNIADE